MTKAELVQRVHRTMGDSVTKKTVEEIIDLGFDEVRKSVKKEKRFSYPGFGTFTVRLRKARRGLNPQTGQEIKIPASKTVGFKPAPKFKSAL